MKKGIIFVLVVIGVLSIVGCNNTNPSKLNNINNDGIEIVTSLEDEIGANTAWCGTFNLIWNDLKNDLAKQDIIFSEQSAIVDNLNKGTFTTEQLNDDSYYKVYGIATLELKEQIEKAIKEKFNETSDILDDFDWVNRTEKDYFLYCMLKKEFEFPKVFTKLENDKFEDYENVKYFGINSSTDEAVDDQINVLYYNSSDDFAVKLKTKGNDEVILTVGNEGKTFLDIYNSVLENRENYEGSYGFRDSDTLKVPYITFNLKENITEVENKPFTFSNGEPYVIEQALQTIKFELDEKGGRIKSEAGMMAKNESIAMPLEPRHFTVDEEFTIFLIEKNEELPYFAAKISDISTVQTDVKKKIASVQANAEDTKIKYSENFELIFTSNDSEKNNVNSENEKLNINKIISKGEVNDLNYNVYSVNGDVKINIDGIEYTLREALLNNKISMGEIIQKANKDFPEVLSYDDGGTMEYQYDDYTFIKCHTLAGNRDAYICRKDITLNDLDI